MKNNKRDSNLYNSSRHQRSQVDIRKILFQYRGPRSKRHTYDTSVRHSHQVPLIRKINAIVINNLNNWILCPDYAIKQLFQGIQSCLVLQQGGWQNS